MLPDYFVYCLIGCVLFYTLYKLHVRLQLSRAKHPSLRGHSKWSRRIAKKIPYFSYQGQAFFQADGAPESIVEKRKNALSKLKNGFELDNAKTIEMAKSLGANISDMQFTREYRVPFPFRAEINQYLHSAAFAQKTHGTQVQDLDGNWRYDLTGSYGVNVFGYDFYKSCMDKGIDKTRELGPVLGAYHPIIAENVKMIKAISGLDEVSFHMSGTEAIMQAVRLARYHTGKTHLVRMCGAYHGWWDGVQPGIGNNRKTHDVYTLADLSEQTLHVLNTRNDIACVLINPFQAFHPNSDAPSDVSLVASDRATNFDKQAYCNWLVQIRDICSRRNIVLIMDEVFAGFRLGYRGAQEYFGIQADLVTYGKTLGGGLPVGVLAGKKALMKRFKDEAPVDVSFARGTFNSHPYVMGAMNEFLVRIQSPEIQAIYQNAEVVWDQRVEFFNQALFTANLPLKITNMHSILSVIYTQPSRYNWMLQFYLKQNGIELSWTGTGRLIMSLNYSQADFEAMVKRFVEAALTMQKDGWWWQGPNLTNKAIKRQFLMDMLGVKFPLIKPLLPSPLVPEFSPEFAPQSLNSEQTCSPDNPSSKVS